MSKGTSKVNDNANIAARFEILAENLISIRTVYERTVPEKQSQKNYPEEKLDEYYLYIHLRHILMENCFIKLDCICCQLKDGQDSNPRIQLPSTIMKCLKSVHSDLYKYDQNKKIPVSWISCFLNDNRPKKN